MRSHTCAVSARPDQSLGGRSLIVEVALDLEVINAACVSSCCSPGLCGLTGRHRPKRRSSSRLNTNCELQLLSSCSVTFRCIGFWCHRRRIPATFRQEDAGASQYRRRRHWLTTKGSVPVSSTNVTNTLCSFLLALSSLFLSFPHLLNR